MAGRDVARVINRCDQAKEDRRLNLSRCDLTQIPDAVFLLLKNTMLESCNISQNLIRRIPSKLAVKFSSVSELHFNNNHLSSLPDELRQMEGLTLLDISHNHFTALPSVVYRVDSLKILNAQSNSIKEVDVQRLKHMPSMSELNLQDNPLHLDIHSQLMGLAEDITVLVTPQDPELDAVD
ncbi:unnamed protein product [Candidula unifasciata]|uniref:Leucine-rich repeat-containing protein 20 n=1 Tax=Candidula unifasciata TaxID=100452 RepID=A0A8S3Z104_9EUPU|nr:unnamed protein product [Candidula unifasciata]